MIQIKGKQISVELTLDELGTTLEGLMGYVAWLETAIEGKAKNQELLESELDRCHATLDKLDKIWCDEGNYVLKGIVK